MLTDEDCSRRLNMAFCPWRDGLPFPQSTHPEQLASQQAAQDQGLGALLQCARSPGHRSNGRAHGHQPPDPTRSTTSVHNSGPSIPCAGKVGHGSTGRNTTSNGRLPDAHAHQEPDSTRSASKRPRESAAPSNACYSYRESAAPSNVCYSHPPPVSFPYAMPGAYLPWMGAAPGGDAYQHQLALWHQQQALWHQQQQWQQQQAAASLHRAPWAVANTSKGPCGAPALESTVKSKPTPAQKKWHEQEEARLEQSAAAASSAAGTQFTCFTST
jgi:hypothetical protein